MCSEEIVLPGAVDSVGMVEAVVVDSGGIVGSTDEVGSGMVGIASVELGPTGTGPVGGTLIGGIVGTTVGKGVGNGVGAGVGAGVGGMVTTGTAIVEVVELAVGSIGSGVAAPRALAVRGATTPATSSEQTARNRSGVNNRTERIVCRILTDVHSHRRSKP
jgi:hypothetical protein